MSFCLLYPASEIIQRPPNKWTTLLSPRCRLPSKATGPILIWYVLLYDKQKKHFDSVIDRNVCFLFFVVTFFKQHSSWNVDMNVMSLCFNRLVTCSMKCCCWRTPFQKRADAGSYGCAAVSLISSHIHSKDKLCFSLQGLVAYSLAWLTFQIPVFGHMSLSCVYCCHSEFF